jgi:hypothetical protein
VLEDFMTVCRHLKVAQAEMAHAGYRVVDAKTRNHYLQHVPHAGRVTLKV